MRQELSSILDATLRYAGAVQEEEIRDRLRVYLGEEELDAGTLRDISAYMDILQRWNARINLTAIRDPRQIVARHFGESLFAARNLLRRGSTLAVIDVGSGAGFPGIPLKLFARGIHLTLIEAHGKKATFLREVVRALGLEAVQVLNARAEDCTLRAPLVTMRAVENMEAILPAALKLAAEPGWLALLTSEGRLRSAQRLLEGVWEVREVPAPTDNAGDPEAAGGVLAVRSSY